METEMLKLALERHGIIDEGDSDMEILKKIQALGGPRSLGMDKDTLWNMLTDPDTEFSRILRDVAVKYDCSLMEALKIAIRAVEK